MSGFTPGTPYYAVLTATGPSGTSVPSPEITFTPATAPGTVTDIPFAPVTLDGLATVIDSAATFTGGVDDSVSAALDIGFTFNFYGVDYIQFYLGTNGLVYFGAAGDDGCCWGAMLPNTSQLTQPVIAFIWSDMHTTDIGPTGVAATISYETLGNAPNRMLVIDVRDLSTFETDGYFTGQVILYETTNVVEIHTQTLLPNPAYPFTQGVQKDATTAAAKPERMQFTKSFSNEAVRFTTN
jgi:hypothetical protein